LEYLDERGDDGKEIPGRRTDDSLANFKPITGAVKKFAEEQLEGWYCAFTSQLCERD
jgi:hypothetical protein